MTTNDDKVRVWQVQLDLLRELANNGYLNHKGLRETSATLTKWRSSMPDGLRSSADWLVGVLDDELRMAKFDPAAGEPS